MPLVLTGCNGKIKAWDRLAKQEKMRAKGFRLLEEYECFYLYGKYENDQLLYKECFSKFDIDGVKRNG